MVYTFFNKKNESRAIVTKDLAKELHKPVIKNSKEGKSTRDLKIIFSGKI